MRAFAFAVGFSMVTSLASAQFTYVYDGVNNDYTTGNSSISGTGSVVDAGMGNAGADDYREVLSFSTSNLGFSGNVPATFGGFSTVSADTDSETFPGAVSYIVRGNDSPEVLRSQNALGSTAKVFDGVTLWNISTPVTFDQISLALMNSNSAGSVSQHFVVRADGDYYVSTFGNTTQNADIEMGTSETTWQMWDFTANGGDNFNVEFTSAVAAASLPIDAVGIYTTGTDVAGSFIQSNVSMMGYAVPEPSVYAAICGLLALGLAFYRRR